MQEESADDMLFDLDEDSAVSEPDFASLPQRTHLGMPLHAGAPSSLAAHLPVCCVSPTSMSPTSPQRIRARCSFGQPPLPPRRSSSSGRSQVSCSTADAASTIGPRGSAESMPSREASLDFAAVQGQLGRKLSLDEGTSSPEGGPGSPGPKSLASGDCFCLKSIETGEANHTHGQPGQTLHSGSFAFQLTSLADS